MSHANLACFAPIPRGHRVRLIDLESPGAFLTPSRRYTVAIDLTAGTFYIPYALLPQVRDCQAPELLQGALQSGGLQTVNVYEGEVVAAAVATKDSGDINDVWTRLFLTP